MLLPTPLLGTAHRRDLLLELLEHVRRRHRFVVLGYVLMPEHFHLLISEPHKDGRPASISTDRTVEARSLLMLNLGAHLH